MAAIKIPKGWEIPERQVTSKDVYINRREFIQKLGFTGMGAMGLMMGCFDSSSEAGPQTFNADVRRSIPKPIDPYPASRNPKYTVDRPITTEEIAAAYNNFYEFTTTKEKVWQLAEKFETRPWEIEVGGSRDGSQPQPWAARLIFGGPVPDLGWRPL